MGPMYRDDNEYACWPTGFGCYPDAQAAGDGGSTRGVTGGAA
jgi:hypothetical protein